MSSNNKARTFAPPDNTDGASQFIKFMNIQTFIILILKNHHRVRD